MKIFVTGANGFVGRILCEGLARRGDYVVAAVRNIGSAPECASIEYVTGDLGCLPDIKSDLRDIDCIVHLAGRAHIMQDNPAVARQAYFRTNERGTRHLAIQAAEAGIKRLIYLSSIKVNGEETNGRPFSETDLPCPQDDYGRSKLAAENALIEVASQTGLETVVIRPPLIYGPGVKANFRRLMDTLSYGIPLPLASINNFRSLVNIWNLCDLITVCIDHPDAACETFLVSDGQDLSTPELCRKLGRSLSRPVRLFPVAPSILRLVGSLMARSGSVKRIIGSLQVDSSKATRLLDWHQPVSIEDGLVLTARWHSSSTYTQ